MLNGVTFDTNLGLYLLRLTVGAIFLYHSWGKLTHASQNAKALGMKIPTVLALGTAELLSGLLLIVGVNVQIAAFILCVIMVGALYNHIFKWKTPFGSGKGKGYEFELLLLASSLAILLTGGGNLGFIQSLEMLVR